MIGFRTLVRGILFGATIHVVWLFPSSAYAQTSAIVRAGEHSVYSRLVIPVAEGADWKVTTDERRSIFEVRGQTIEYDIATVFDRIPRTRVLGLSAASSETGANIAISLACDCIVTARASGNFVIVDIQDADQPAAEPGGTDRIEADEPVESVVATGEESSEVEQVPQPTRRDIRGSGDTEDGGIATASAPAPAPKRQKEVVAADAVTERLIAQLEKAAEQGIVDLNELPLLENSTSVPKEDDEQALPSLFPQQGTLDDLEAVAPRLAERVDLEAELPESLRVTVPPSGIVQRDRVDAPKEVTPNEESIGESCIPEAHLDVANWVEDEEIGAQITSLRSRLFGEFDRVDQFVLRDLARLYVAIGFGVEALALLKDIEAEFEGRDVIKELALSAEDRSINLGGVFDLAADCGPRIGLWRAIVVDRSETQPVPDSDEVVKEFAKLPLEVRRRFGPRLVRSLLNRQQTDAARAAFAILDRAVGPHGEHHDFMRARLFETDGDLASAEEIYIDLFRQNKVTAPASLLRLVNLYNVQGRAIPGDMISDLEVLAFEFKDEEMGRDLRLAEIRSKAGNRNLGAALAVVRDALSDDRDAAESYLTAVDQIVQQASVKRTGPAPFATAIFENQSLVLHAYVSAKTKLHVAEELLRLGLPKPAFEFANAARAQGETQAGILLAEAHISMDDPESALPLLEGDEIGSASLASRALTSLGKYSEAFDAHGLADADKAPYSAWLAGEWSQVREDVAPELSEMAEFMSNRVSSPEPDVNSGSFEPNDVGRSQAPSLQSAEASLDNSAALRESIDFVLERY